MVWCGLVVEELGGEGGGDGGEGEVGYEFVAPAADEGGGAFFADDGGEGVADAGVGGWA